MARTTRAWAAAGTALLVAGLGLSVPAPANAGGVPCAGMDAPQNLTPGNTAPTPQTDTTTAIAGGTRIIKVLTNDTDAQGDPLYVVSVSGARNGEVCIDSDGALEYFAGPSAASYVERLTYGVTDGDLYRTTTVTVNVTGVKPLRAQLLHRKAGKRKAEIRFTNPNDRTMTVLAGTPKKRKALLTRTITPGHAVGFKTKYKKIVFFALVRDTDGLPILVDIGNLNTRTGAQSISSGAGGFLRQHPSVRALQRAWLGK
jgi:hypothetical protein